MSGSEWVDSPEEEYHEDDDSVPQNDESDEEYSVQAIAQRKAESMSEQLMLSA